MKRIIAVWLAMASLVFAQEQPTPYELIRNPLPDTLDQKIRDSLNIKINPIRVNQAGYRVSDTARYFYYVGSAASFDVIDSAGAVVGSGTFGASRGSTASSINIRASNNATRTTGGDTRYTMSGTGPSGTLLEAKLPAGLPANQKLRIRVGTAVSADFIISDQTYSMVKDALLKFYGIQRSGDTENWFHRPSHLQDGLQGGWYDCGDHLKEGITQSYALASVSMLAAIFPNRDTDKYGYNHKNTLVTDGIPDMLREARHGADYFMAAYAANGNAVNTGIKLSVGDFGKDHNWWGSPEYQDAMPNERGGPVRPLRTDLWSTTAGRVAAGLAFTAGAYMDLNLDTVWARQAINAAKAFYAYGRASQDAGSSAAYNGEGAYSDDMALAAVALLWATKEQTYASDLFIDPTLGVNASTWSGMNRGGMPGGWLAHTNPSFTHEKANTDWARTSTLALYSFYKLILQTQTIASSYGITAAKRDSLVEDVAFNLSGTLGYVSLGGVKVSLPASNAIFDAAAPLGWEEPWFIMYTQQEWVWNRYQSGNIFDLLAYSDVTKDLKNWNGPDAGIQDWKSDQVHTVGLRQMDYMLGVNPWDISMIYGIGDKNFNHPHHRAANPEGRNTPGAMYRYRPPVGALQGGFKPGATNAYTEHYDDYYHSETCIDGTATIIMPAVILAAEEDFNAAPEVTVQIEYVGFDRAIITVNQTRFGTATINLGTQANVLNLQHNSDSAGVRHQFELTGLQSGTTYFFTATAFNQRSGNNTVKYLVDSTQTPYEFTTLNSPPAAADIQNVKVCNVSADSAEIMWYTPNGEYDSKVYYDSVLTSYDQMRWNVDHDITGLPTKFHRVKIGGIKETTRYFFVVESNGSRRAVDLAGLPLEFTTPVTQMKFDVRVITYQWGGMPALGINVTNMEPHAYDSLEVRFYMRAGEGLDRDVAPRFDICQAYDESGFNLPCDDPTLAAQVSARRPIKMEDTYDPVTQTWNWYLALPLGSTVVKSGSRIRLDVILDRRSPWPPYTDLMNQPPVHIPGAADWSWAVHTRADGDPVDYNGIPTMDKEASDVQPWDIPVNNYVTVYRKNEFVWGFSPSYTEMSNKRADYEMTVEYEAPFDVPNGSFVALDASSSTVYARGKAWITEGGQVTDIWVNGVKINLNSEIVSYNLAGGYYDLNIPVRLTLGGNSVDITVFAGPDANCIECQKNGGCAFDNRSYYFQYSRGNFTPASLTITDVATNQGVASPAVPGQTRFTIQVRDMDKVTPGVPSVQVLVINPRKQDTLQATLNLSNGQYVLSTPILAVNRSAAETGAGEIAFFGGDTIIVRYTDADDPEDVAEQRFFAEPAYPVPVSALVVDGNCDGVMDTLRITFSQPFGQGDRVDSLWLSVRDPLTQQADSFHITPMMDMSNQTSLNVVIPSRPSLPVTGAPNGYVAVYMKPLDGPREVASINLSDGIAPVLIGISLLENPTPRSAQDTIKISFNEAVVLQSKRTWPLSIWNGSVLVDQSSINVVTDAVSTDGGRSWVYVIENNSNGAIVDSGYVARISNGFSITDLGLNALIPDGGCSELVPVIEVPKPVPVLFSEMRDIDADGSADQLYLRFARQLRQKDMLDSFNVRWGSEGLLKSLLPPSSGVWVVGQDTSSREEGQITPQGDSILVRVIDTISTITISFADSTWPYGSTSGPMNGRGTVVPRLGPVGGFFDKEYSVADQVGPVILSARKGSLGSSGRDSLGIVISEPIDTASWALFIDRRRGTTVTQLVPQTVLGTNAGRTYVFIYEESSPGEVRVGDYVRLVPSTQGVQDKALNAPGINNPWVPVLGTLTNSVRYEVTMIQGVTGKNPGSAIYTIDPPQESTHFRLTILDPNTGREIKVGEGSGTLSATGRGSAYDTAQYRHIGPTFDVVAKLPGALIQSMGTDVWSYTINMALRVYDNLGQYIDDCQIQFGLDEIGHDYLSADGELRMRLEWMSHEGRGPKSKRGRLIASGAYIGVFNFNTQAVALVDDPGEKDASSGRWIRTPQFRKFDVIKSKETEQESFGFMRYKQ